MFVHDGVAWGAPSTTRFVYHGWNLLTEYSVSGSTLTLQRKNTWGLDLAGVHGGSGALDAAGGIGGLLATLDTQGTTATTDDKKYIYFYDANGNVGQAVDTTTSVTIAARYEYDAYGVNVLDAANLAQSGPYAAKNPFRFSTKWFDDETTLGYWGYRYYLPSIGRWASRDPIEERGGVLLYNFIFNRPQQATDAVGLAAAPCGQPKTYGIDGTAFVEFGSVREISEPSNVVRFCKEVVGETWYYPGVGTGADTGRIGLLAGQAFGEGTYDRARALRDAICADVCSDCPPAQINVVGWSRAAISALEAVALLEKRPCCCKWVTEWPCPTLWSLGIPRRYCCDVRNPQINFLGLLDPVDMRLAAPPTRIPGNVQNCVLVIAGESSGTTMFPPHTIDTDERTRLFYIQGDHGAAGIGSDAYDALRRCACDSSVKFEP